MLERPSTDEEQADWRRLVETELVRPTALELYVADRDGGNVVQVTSNGRSNWAPFLHPDGERIIFRGIDDRDYVTIQPEGANTTNLLVDNDVSFSAKPQEQSGFMAGLMMWLPVLVLYHTLFNLSLGLPLSDFALPRAALLALRLSIGQQPHAEIAVIVHVPDSRNPDGDC